MAMVTETSLETRIHTALLETVWRSPDLSELAGWNPHVTFAEFEFKGELDSKLNGCKIMRTQTHFEITLPSFEHTNTIFKKRSQYTVGKTEEKCIKRLLDWVDTNLPILKLRDETFKAFEANENIEDNALEIACDWLEERGLTTEDYFEMTERDCKLVLSALKNSEFMAILYPSTNG